MRYYFTKFRPIVWVALVVVSGIFLSMPVQAQETTLSDVQIAALVARFLPPGGSLTEATDDQLDDVVSQAVLARPDAAASIVSYFCRTIPAKAEVIVYAAVRVLPDARDAIVDAAKAVTPPERHQSIERAAQKAYAQATNSEIGNTATGSAQTEWSPTKSRDDAPLSPRKP